MKECTKEFSIGIAPRNLVARYDGAVQPEDRNCVIFAALTHRSSRWYSSQVLSAKKALISKSIADM